MRGKLTIGSKLVLLGTLIVIIPLVVVGTFAVSKAASSLTDLMHGQMGSRAAENAMLIDSVFRVEQKLVMELAVGNASIAAAEAVASKGLAKSMTEADSLNQKLARFIATKNLGEEYQAVIADGLDGVIFSASSDIYHGVSVAERPYFQRALSGIVNTGAAQIATAINQLDSVIQHTASIPEEFNATSEDISGQSDDVAATAHELAEQASKLQETMDFFAISDRTSVPVSRNPGRAIVLKNEPAHTSPDSSEFDDFQEVSVWKSI